ncbi:GIY-YIG nuclease family protein [Tissierella praeacuta]|uniref:GIY-YIG nuclease family protein n=1 Tax=Tissierella praeacuta TaxID=43131 RepID=UPI0028AE5541|nr:hypothetical protein [Tissierella praeacuta]
MKGKRSFTTVEIQEIIELIEQKVAASKSEQRNIRNKIRSLGFYFSDFSNKKVYTIDDLNELIQAGEIEILDDKSSEELKTNSNISENILKEVDISESLVSKNNFKGILQLDNRILGKKGFYCIRLTEKSKLPNRYQSILEERQYKFIYIGKAEKTLMQRLEQELEHKSPGTFFRSIGCVLGYSPIKGHLIGKSNQDNFKFSKEDTSKIISWLKENVEISIVEYEGNFDLIEGELISKYTPLLNIDKNPSKLQELINDRKRCKNIAIGLDSEY